MVLSPDHPNPVTGQRRSTIAIQAPASIPDLLAAWRAADRRWEQAVSGDEARAAALDVIRAWTAYQDAALGDRPSEFMLVADDEGVYVAATAGVEDCLGYPRDSVIGMRVSDVAAADLVESTPVQWAGFLAAGRQEGSFRLRAVDGAIVNLRYHARAHNPIAGFHMSRLWPEQPEGAKL